MASGKGEPAYERRKVSVAVLRSYVFLRCCRSPRPLSAAAGASLLLVGDASLMLTRLSFRSSRSLMSAWYVDECCRMGNRSVTRSVISSRGRDRSLTRQSYSINDDGIGME